MSSTNKTTYYELSQYVGADKPTYLGDYNSDMLKIDTGLHAAADAADTALTTANAASSAATTASTTASTALSTAQSASTTASQAQTTAETASTNANEALTAASTAETAAAANTITNLAPAYDSTLTYEVGDLVTYIDAQGSGKMYKCIVAVTVPEAFNINKWDDVTVSEAFATPATISSDVFTATSTSTYTDLLNWLYEHMPSDPENYEIVSSDSTDFSTNITKYVFASKTANIVMFIKSRVYPTTGEFSSLNIKGTSGTESNACELDVSPDGVIFQNFTNNAISVGHTFTYRHM